MFRSIRWRIAIPYVILIVITMLGLSMYISGFIRDVHTENLESTLISQARLIGDSIAPSIKEVKDSGEIDALARHWAEVLNTRVTIIGVDGTVLGESHEDRTTMDNHLSRPEIKQAITEGQGASIRYSQTIGYDMFYAGVPIEDGEEVIGYARLALSMDQVDADITLIRRNIYIATAILAGVIIILGILIAERTTYPIRTLSSAVNKMAAGDLSISLSPRTQDEIGELTVAIDTMARQLRNQFEILHTERSRFAAILDQMTDGVVIVDQAGHVELINPAAQRLFDVDADNVGEPLSLVLRHHSPVNLWSKSRQTGKTQVETIEFYNPRRFIQVVAMQLGGVLEENSLLIFQDLTNIRRLETIRRDFISNISHELRTPLASLKALSETLQSGALEDPPAARRFLGQIEMEVDALSQMVSELLELARIESGQVPFQLATVSPCEILAQAYDRMCLQAERAQITPRLDCPEELPDILADPSRLEQVFVNLIHNAIKFTLPEGEINVSVKRDGNDILFEIQDTGVGISIDDLPRIFERFYKTDRARAEGGTGLGLAIAKHLVEAHGGKIWVDSVEGKGSSFFVSIPIAE
ncbi:MAG: ATP-binding protein [Anaerolineales bacterium]|jgi:two-component system phosphate regulon sensor histidine kinase PhoR